MSRREAHKHGPTAFGIAHAKRDALLEAAFEYAVLSDQEAGGDQIGVALRELVAAADAYARSIPRWNA